MQYNANNFHIDIKSLIDDQLFLHSLWRTEKQERAFWDTPFDELFQGTEMHKASKSFKVAPCLQHQVEATWSQKEVVCCLKS